MNIAFRVDASHEIGIGHVMRCLTLATVLQKKGAEVRFICREHEGNLIDFIRGKSITVTVLPVFSESYTLENDYSHWLGIPQVKDAQQTIKMISDEQFDWLVIDHYGINHVWQSELIEHVDNIMVIDDLALQQQNCQVLLNQNFIRGLDVKYKKLTSDNCELLLGPQYSLLKPEYINARKSLSEKNGTLERILIFFTAGHDYGETLKAMEGVSQFESASHVDVVVGLSNEYQEDIKNICLKKGWDYHCQVDYMPQLIAAADLVIGACGVNTWERCVLGAPALCTILAENQRDIAEQLHDKNIIVSLGWFHDTKAETYCQALHKLSEKNLLKMSANAMQLVDGNGIFRVSEYLLSTTSSDKHNNLNKH